MKKIFTLLCAAVIAAATMDAEVLLKESFANTKDSLTTSETRFGDEIASSGWSGISGSGAILLNSTDLTYADYKTATDGTGSAEFLNNKVKKAATPLSKSVNSGSIYVAAILNLENYSTTSATASTRDYLWALVNGTSGVSTAGNHFCRLQMQKIADNQFQFGIAKQAESAAFISYTDTYAYGKFLLVTEYEFVSGDQNDIVRLYVNPAKGDKPAATIECKQSFINPNTSADVGSGTKPDAAQLKTILLNSSSTLKLAAHLDELKVVTDWADLWEAGEAPKTPTIIADNKIEFGNVPVNEASSKKFTVKGENLSGNIGITINKEGLVASTTTITKEQAEAEGGYEVTLTVTPTATGLGSTTIILSSSNATNKNIAVTWNAVAPVSKISIADAKKLAPDSEVALNDVVITRIFQDGLAVTVQDATGALNLADYYGVCTSGTVGDKISGLQGAVLASEDYIEGFFTVFPMAGNIAASGVAIEPLAVTLADFTKYGPAYIKVEGVSFPSDKDKFAAGGITISQDAASANMQILAGCDIIGEDVPSKADVKGIVCHPYFTDNILIEKSADVYNRVAKEPTGFENVQSTGKAVKVVRDGQLIILRDGKEYNVLGVEK